MLSCPAQYLAGKEQPWVVPQFLSDLTAAEHAVVSMTWEAIVAQPTYGTVGLLRFFDHGSARFVFIAQAGAVAAHGAEPILTQ